VEFLQHSDKTPRTVQPKKDLFDVYVTLLLQQQRLFVYNHC